MTDWPIFALGVFVTSIVAFAVWNVGEFEAELLADKLKLDASEEPVAENDPASRP